MLLLSSADFFFQNSLFLKHSFKNTDLSDLSNGLDPDPDLIRFKLFARV